MKFAKTYIAVAFALTGFAAHAATVTDITTATATLDFEAPVTLTHTLTAVSNLQAGSVADNTPVANGEVTLSGSTALPVVVSPSTTMQVGTGLGANIMTLSGTSDATHKLVVDLVSPSGADMHGQSVAGRQWFTLGADNKYSIQVSGAQTVSADQYNVSIDAALYNA